MSKFSYLAKALFLGVIMYFIFDSHIIPSFIKYAAAGWSVLLLISPRSWFGMKNLFLRGFRRSQKIGTPDQDKLNVLIMLFRLRYLEVYDTYARLRYRQEEAKDTNWILLHLKERADELSEVDSWSDKKDAKIKKNEAKASAVFTKLFDFKNIYDTDQTIRSAIDLEIDFSHHLASQKLVAIRSFGVFKDDLDDLIRNYQFLDDTYPDRFHDCFGDFIINRIGKEERRTAHRGIIRGWRRVFDILKAYLIYFESRGEMQELTASLFKEIEMLEEMTSCLSSALRQENTLAKRSYGSPREEVEKAFMEKLSTNPLWAKSFL